MNQRQFIANSILWAAAIVAAALASASTTFTLILLPSLGGVALLTTRPRRPAPCRR